MIHNDADVPKYRKKNPSSVSKSKEKSKHKHKYEECLLVEKKKKIIHTELHIALFVAKLEICIFLKQNRVMMGCIAGSRIIMKCRIDTNI